MLTRKSDSELFTDAVCLVHTSPIIAYVGCVNGSYQEFLALACRDCGAQYYHFPQKTREETEDLINDFLRKERQVKESQRIDGLFQEHFKNYPIQEATQEDRKRLGLSTHDLPSPVPCSPDEEEENQ